MYQGKPYPISEQNGFQLYPMNEKPSGNGSMHACRYDFCMHIHQVRDHHMFYQETYSTVVVGYGIIIATWRYAPHWLSFISYLKHANNKVVPPSGEITGANKKQNN